MPHTLGLQRVHAIAAAMHRPRCLPPAGNYSVGKFPTPFCWAPNVFCAANSRNISDTLCRPLPLSPKQCGAPGGPCCPSAYGLVTDKPLPPPCQASRGWELRFAVLRQRRLWAQQPGYT